MSLKESTRLRFAWFDIPLGLIFGALALAAVTPLQAWYLEIHVHTFQGFSTILGFVLFLCAFVVARRWPQASVCAVACLVVHLTIAAIFFRPEFWINALFPQSRSGGWSDIFYFQATSPLVGALVATMLAGAYAGWSRRQALRRLPADS